MILTLLFAAFAHAGDATCDQLVELARAGLGTRDLVSYVETVGIITTDLDCVKRAELPDLVKVAAMQSVAAERARTPVTTDPGTTNTTAPGRTPGADPTVPAVAEPGAMGSVAPQQDAAVQPTTDTIGPTCYTGKPCGQTCIPIDRTCHIEEPRTTPSTVRQCDKGKPCGASCIAMDKTCHR